MIIGNIGETSETITDTVIFLKRAKPDIIASAGGLWIFPGTKLYETCKRKGFINDDFWLSDEPYKVYTLEHSLAELADFHKKITSLQYTLCRRIATKIRRILQ